MRSKHLFMKFFFEFLPIVVFFAVYKFFGVFAATAATIGVTLLQVVVHWIQYRRVPSFLLLSLILVVLLGGSTLLFHNVLFIKWKPSVLYWVLSTVFLGSQLFQEKPIMQRLLEKTATSIMLPRSAWHSLNLAWAIFFALMGFANIFVAYHFTTNAWVNFKLFGILGLTLLFSVAQAFYLARYVKETP